MRQKRIWGSNPHLSARLFHLRVIIYAHTPCGGVAEWLNAAVSKTVSPVTRVTRVRIPPPPPEHPKPRRRGFFIFVRTWRILRRVRTGRSCAALRTCLRHVLRRMLAGACAKVGLYAIPLVWRYVVKKSFRLVVVGGTYTLRSNDRDKAASMAGAANVSTGNHGITKMRFEAGRNVSFKKGGRYGRS